MMVISWCVAHFWRRNERNCGVPLMLHALKPGVIWFITGSRPHSLLMHLRGASIYEQLTLLSAHSE